MYTNQSQYEENCNKSELLDKVIEIVLVMIIQKIKKLN